MELLQVVGRDITDRHPGTSCQEKAGCHQAHARGAAKDCKDFVLHGCHCVVFFFFLELTEYVFCMRQ